MRFLPFLLLFTAVGFAAEEASDNQPSKYSQELQFKVAEKTQSDGLYENALKLWNEFLKKYPQSDLVLEAKFNRGFCFYNLQKYDDAKRDIDEVLKSGDKAPFKAEALLICGLSARQLAPKDHAMYQEAKKRLEALLEEFPDDKNIIMAKFNLAKVNEKLGSLDDAKKLYIEIWQKSPKSEFASDAYLQTGYILFNQKMFSQSSRLALEFSKRWNLRPEIYSAAVLAGDSLYRLEKYAEAEKQYAFASDPKAADIDKFDKVDYALYNRGVCMLQLHDFANAAQLFSDVITRFPKSEYVLDATLASGDAYWKSGNAQKAKEYLLKASESEKFSPKANLILAEIYFQENDIEQALKRIDLTPELLFKCLPDEPEERQAAVRQACVLRVNIFSKTDDPKRLQTCVNLCDKIARQWPDASSAPWATMMAVQIEFKQKNYDNAIELCHKIQTQWKNCLQYKDSQILEASCLAQTEKYKEAGNLYYSLYKNNPDDSRRYDWLVSTCRMLDLFQQYETIYKILPKEIPNIKSNALRPEALFLSGKAANELDKLDFALKVLQFCQDKYPAYANMDKVLYIQGLVYEKQNNNGKALETFQKILDKYPGSSVKQAASYRITQLYRQMGNSKAALDQADKIIAQDVNSTYRPGAILDSMFILVKNGMWEQALSRGDLFINDYPQHDTAAEAYRLRALCKYNLQKYSEATADCRQGLIIAKQKNQLDQWELSLRQLEVSSLALQDDKIDETQTAFDAFIQAKTRLNKTVPNEDAVFYLYANALSQAGKTVEANKQYKYVYENFKSSRYRFECAFSLGMASINLKRFDTAKALLTFAVKGTDVVAAIKSANKLGWLAYNEKSYEEALNWFTRAVNLYDASKDDSMSIVADFALDSRIMTADCLYWQKKFADALTNYKKLPELPIQYKAMTTLRTAQCALETGEIDLAAKLIDSVLDANNAIIPELVPMSKNLEPALQHLRAKIWFKTKKFDQAEELFELIVKQNENIDPAAIPPASYWAIAESWFYLGELTFNKGSVRDAIPLYYKVVYGFKIPDLQADSCYEAARCFESIKQINQARKMYQTIVDDFPNSSKAPIARRKLAQLKQINP